MRIGLELYKTPGCIPLAKGANFEIVSQDKGYSEVRPVGSEVTYWTANEFTNY